MRYAKFTMRSALLFLPFVCFLTVLCGFSSAHAADPADKLLEIKEKLETTLQDLTDVKKEEKSVMSKIKNINTEISDKEKELSQYNKRIAKTRSEIKAISEEIDRIKERLESSQQYMEEHIIALFKRQYNNDAMILISSDDYNELIRKSRYISLVAYHNNKVLTEYKDELKKINSQKRKLEELQAALNANRASVSKKKNEFQSDLAKKDRLLAEVKARRIAQEKRIKDLEASSRKIAGMVNELHAKQMPASILGKGFRSQKGQLPWPVKGEVVASFGKYKDPEFDLDGFRNGIEIKAISGDTAMAIAGGRVVYASMFEGFGNMLIIDHGNGYHSLYGNLSEMALKTGNLVVHGMNVGKISKPADSKLPVLYFEIRYKGKPINPKDWLE